MHLPYFLYFVRIYSLNTEVRIYQIVYAFGVFQKTFLIINISVSSGLFPRHRGWYAITPAWFYWHPPYAYMYMQHTLSNVDLYTALQRQYLLTCKVSRYCALCAPANTMLNHVDLMLGQRRRHWPNINNNNNNIFIRTRGTCTCNRTITFKV